jgi:hypothetical protein
VVHVGKLKIVVYIFSAAMTMRALIDALLIVQMFLGWNFKSAGNPVYAILLILFYVAFEISPVFIILLVIKKKERIT